MVLRIKEVIKSKGMDVKDLAEKMGISRVGLSQHINGNPSVEVLKRISDALGVHISELFTPVKMKNAVNGYIEYKDVIYKIDSKEALKSLLAEVEKENSGEEK